VSPLRFSFSKGHDHPHANAVPAVVRLAPDLKIIVQAANNDESHTVDLYRRGVRGIIPAPSRPICS